MLHLSVELFDFECGVTPEGGHANVAKWKIVPGPVVICAVLNPVVANIIVL